MTTEEAEELLSIATETLGQVTRGQAEVIAVRQQQELTRFAGNVIHQNVAESSLQLRVRVIDDSRVGVAQVRGEVADGPLRVVQAAEQARSLSGRSDPSPLPSPDGVADSPAAYSVATTNTSPEDRAGIAAAVVDAATRQRLEAFGSVSTRTTRTAIVNSNGVRRHAASTQASVITVMRGRSGAGYAAGHSPDITGIDANAVGVEAADTCARNQDATAIDPGEYEVVLTPYAVTDMVEHLAWMGFSALAKQERRSFMHPGSRMMSETVSISDDPADPGSFPFPFDQEGVSSRRVVAIDHGVCAGFLYDTPSARRDGVASTGHSLPQPNTFGPYARHLVMDAGGASPDDLVAAVKRGLFVTRLWYVRDVHPLRTIITGMTREGTFLIENGKIGRAVRDLRFTQSIVDALNDVRGISRERKLALGEDESGVLTPWLHLGRFAFTS